MQYEIIIFSDAHFLNPAFTPEKLFLEFVQTIDPLKTKLFILNGDIFDFIFGGRSYFSKKWQLFADALLKLYQSGIRVVYIQGNHEFAPNSLKWPGVEFICKDYFVYKNIVFTHGDILNAPWHYFYYRAFVRSPLFKWVGMLVPPDFLDRLAVKISGYSRGKDKFRKLDHAKILEKAMQYLNEKQGSSLIFGHFHQAYYLAKNSKQVICVKSWQEPNFLGYREGQFYRIIYKKKAWLEFPAIKCIT